MYTPAQINAKRNLNDLYVDNAEGENGYEDPPPFVDSKDARVTAYFCNLKKHLIEKIKGGSSIMGCVAWLTDPDILDALAEKNVQIVVQKEDFLRPDITQSTESLAVTLNSRYQRLKSGIHKEDISGMISYGYSINEPLDAVRCMGNNNIDKNPAHPRMHNKFIVFVNQNDTYDDDTDQCTTTFVPYAVWTGSFNFTECATMSMENALYIEDEVIAKRYYDEWFRIFMLSEPLNWESEWSAPEFRIGS